MPGRRRKLALAWARAQGEDVVPLVGARRRDQLDEALGALAVVLTTEELARIARAIPAGAIAGERCMPAVLAQMDSERTTERRAFRPDER